jgi:NADP-dependent aldehyde dehydrogenase
MEFTGKSFIGFKRGKGSKKVLFGINPANGEALQPAFHSAGLVEVDEAARLAEEAFAVYRNASGATKANFLRTIATNIERVKDDLIVRANLETALPIARLQNETGRACFQLRLFADLVEEGSWVDARIDRAIPDRKPLPKPDVRSMLRPLGAVAVFCAGNFPIAFSVAGGDTASAFAAGCPVVVIAHYAHPGTSEIAGQAISDAVRFCGLPEGVFSLLFAVGNEVGQSVVSHPSIKAVGFTGSRKGGLALMRLTQSRSEPIPFYAEMSSVNPVFILPNAMKERGEQIATGLHASVTLGVGQFCTNPGLVFLNEDEDSTTFAAKMKELIAATPSATMLTKGIADNYKQGTNILSEKISSLHYDSSQSTASLFQTNADEFLNDKTLSEEVFGPSTILVTSSNKEQLIKAVQQMEGQLTATIHGTEEDLREYSDLISIIETKAGRLIFNGFPTGVEVTHAMVHGGPFPSTSDGRSTSVGTRAIYRFVHPVCYQDFPQEALPDELKDENPLGIMRLVDGEFMQHGWWSVSFQK